MSDEHFLNLQPGTVVNGRYEIVKCLGTGSMGMVYACRHRELSGHLVAMKVLFSEVARDEVAAARFRNEIVASYGVSHPNVVRAYEYFRDGDLIAFTMEYIGGGDLADRLNSDEPIPIEMIVSYLSQMCSGVQAIHEAGIIHRDLKPENILLTNQGDIKITDFGIARTGTGPKLTEHGGVVGTIDYVSPEYLEKGQVDTRSDIYALGVLAFEMITGEAPFKGKSVIETMTMRLKTDPLSPKTMRPECPDQLSEIILRALARDPNKRYQSAKQMLVDLQSSGGSLTDSSGSLSAMSVGASDSAEDSHIPENVASFQRVADDQASEGSFVPTSSSKETASGTMSLRPHSRVDARVNGEIESNSDEDYLPLYQMESVLAKSMAGKQDDSQSQISISQSRLPAQRISQLSRTVGSGVQRPRNWINLVLYIAIICVGFGFGVLILNKYFPQVLSSESKVPYSSSRYGR